MSLKEVLVGTATAATLAERVDGSGVRRVLDGLRAVWTGARRSERVAYFVAAVLVASGLFHAGVFAIDGGSWEGPVSWRKPITFGLSVGLTLATITWTMSFLRLGERTRTVLLGGLVYACAVEVFCITLQRWRGKASHFNEETPLDSFIGRFGVAAGGGVIFVLVLVIAVLNLRRAPLADLPRELRLALRAGWLILFAAMVFGVLMVATAVGITAAPGEGVDERQAAYASTGFLKPAHGVTMHAILVLPMLAWLTRFLPWTPARRLRTVAWATTGYTLLAGAVCGEALARTTPLTAPWWANAIAAAGAATLAIAALRIVAPLAR